MTVGARACRAVAATSLACGVLTITGMSTGQPGPGAPPYAVWPIPREGAVESGRLLLTDAVIVVPDGDPRLRAPGNLLAQSIADEFGAVIPVVEGTAPTGRIPIYVGDVQAPVIQQAAAGALGSGCPGPEGYVLRVDDTRAVVAGCDFRGAMYGVGTFLQLVHQWGAQSVAVQKAAYRDWPFLPVRWVHVYLPGRDSLAYARQYMRDVLVRYKFNGMIVEVGGGMRLESQPEISVGWQRTVEEWYAHGETMDKLHEGIPLGTANRFAASCHFGVGGGAYIEKQEVRDFARDAEALGLEIVPEIQGLSHSYYIAIPHRELAEDPAMPWPDSYCPSNPESYRVLFNVMDEYIEVLRPKRVHIGHDEWRAGAFCSRCRGKDPGRLYAEDVLKIERHLEEKGLEVWMWGDHLVDFHNRFGKSASEGFVVQYEKPDTASARDILRDAGARLRILNWSGEKADPTFAALRWPFIVGNLDGASEKDWAARVKRSGLLGGEVSTWGAFDEFQMGKLNIPNALFSANLLWSVHYPDRDHAFEHVGRLLPRVRRLLSTEPPPSLTATPMRFSMFDIGAAFNHGLIGADWDLSGLTPGDHYDNRLPFHLEAPARSQGRAAVIVERQPGGEPQSVPLPISGRWASLIFFQATTGPGRESIHAGDQTHFPRESSELLGMYEIRYADGLVTSHDIRYEETVGAWNAGVRHTTYFAPTVVGGTLPDGRKAALWASEWRNPRPDVPIVAVTLRGVPGPSTARPLLFAVTAVEKPRVEDYR
jgi:hypothetical protein